MKTTKTYDSKRLTLSFTYLSQSLTKSELKNIEKAMPSFIRALDLELKNYTGIKHFSVDLSLIGDAKMKQINFKHRAKNKTTDVLSFPMQEDVRKIKKQKLPELFLGDILISKPVALKQAREFSISFEREFYHLLIHGLLHVLGYDHERGPREERLMFSLEEKILKKMLVQFPKL